MSVGHRDMYAAVCILGDGQTPLRISDQEKGICVIIHCKLNFEHNIAATINMANSILGVIHCTLHHEDGRILFTSYQSQVRLPLEFANILAPHLEKPVYL